MSPAATPPAGFPAPRVPDGPGEALCRRFCRRLRRTGTGDPVCGRPVSWDGIALCRRFCRGFAAGQPVIAVRRPRRRRPATEIRT